MQKALVLLVCGTLLSGAAAVAATFAPTPVQAQATHAK
jgi:hypothetical protein